MASGSKMFRRIQLVKEGTPGTQITTATARLIGILGMQNDQKYYRPDDLETGKSSSYERSVLTGEQAALPFNSDANYEQLAYLLGMTVKGGITPTGPTDSLYTWTYLPNLTSLNSPDTYTFQYGDEIQAFISGFCFGQDLDLSGSIDDVVKVKSNLVGQNVRIGTFTALTNPTALNPAIVDTGKLYVDSSWAGLGGTRITTTLVDFDWKITPGILPIKEIDGNLYFGDRVEKKRHIELEATLGFTSGVAAWFSDFMAQNKKFVRLNFTGPLVGATSHSSLNLDACMVIDTYPTFSERDGQDIVRLKMVSIYDSTSTNEWQVILQNGLAVLP